MSLEPLVVQPTWDAARVLWTWTDGVVCYEAYSRVALVENIEEGEGRIVQLVAAETPQGVVKSFRSNSYYKAVHPQHDAVLDLWSFGNSRKSIARLLELPEEVVHNVLSRARYHKDPRVVTRRVDRRRRAA